MPSVTELSNPYANFLRPVLPTSLGVCSICHTSVIGTFRHCKPCNTALNVLPSIADSLDFVALAVKDEQLAHELAFYKGRYSFDSRFDTVAGLTAVLWRWLKVHEDCVAKSAGVESFPVVTSIPSTRNRDDHPLAKMVGEKIGLNIDRYQTLLESNLDFPDNREFSVQRFRVTGEVGKGVPILIIDDTFTTGSRVQSASAVLKMAGAGPVGVVCIGRHYVVAQEGEFGKASRSYFKRSLDLGWNWDSCCLCDKRII